MTAATESIALQAFLDLSETKPVSEYIDGEIVQKPMPKARHSRLQGKLISIINAAVEKRKIAYAFPELRCTFGGRSIVPNIAVLRWNRIELNAAGEPVDAVEISPDWTIEILSPDRSSNRVIGNILHGLKHGCSLGWLIDPDDRSILVFQPNQQPELCLCENILTVLAGVEFTLTVNQIFLWLKMQ